MRRWADRSVYILYLYGGPYCRPSVPTLVVTLSQAAPALFVTLSTLAQGRFSRNAFYAPAGVSELLFLPHNDGQYEVLWCPGPAYVEPAPPPAAAASG